LLEKGEVITAKTVVENGKIGEDRDYDETSE
jgi:hypothetical protein